MRRRSRAVICSVVVLVVLLGIGGVLVGPPGFGSEGEQSEEPQPVTFDNESLDLELPDVAVNGVADVEPGTELRVVLEANRSIEDGPFYAPATVTVQESGEFTAEYDVTALVPGTEVTVSAYDTNNELLGVENAVVTVSWADVDAGEKPVEFDEIGAELSAPNGTVSGTAQVEPGTELAVRLSSVPRADTPIFLTETTTVGDEGAFEVDFDLTNLESDTDARIVVTAREQIPLATLADVPVEAPEDAGTSDGDDSLLAGNETVHDYVEIEPQEPLWFDTGTTIVNGTVDDVDTDVELVVLLREDESEHLGETLVEQTVRIDQTGEFSVELDTSDVAPGTEIRLDIVHPDLPETAYFEGVVLDENE